MGGKKRTVWLVVILGAVATLAVGSYRTIRDAFGPMEQNESQCLLCGRERFEKWVCGQKVADSTTSNQYSDWIDSFFPATHSHVWLVHTHHYRRRWFGPAPIGCGGVPALSTIFMQRDYLGENDARRLVFLWHQMVQAPGFDPGNLKAMDEFVEVVSQDPKSLLKKDRHR